MNKPAEPQVKHIIHPQYMLVKKVDWARMKRSNERMRKMIAKVRRALEVKV